MGESEGMGKGGMIYYHTWTWFWWLRLSGSPIGKPMAWFPSLVCVAVVWMLQEFKMMGTWDGMSIGHPYVHQIFAITVSFLLVSIAACVPTLLGGENESPA